MGKIGQRIRIARRRDRRANHIRRRYRAPEELATVEKEPDPSARRQLKEEDIRGFGEFATMDIALCEESPADLSLDGLNELFSSGHPTSVAI